MFKKIKIPPNHRRSLSVTAQAMERELDEIEILLRSHWDHKLTSKTEITYSDKERESILDLISELKKLNEEMFYIFDLEPKQTTDKQVIQAKASYLWTILMDSEPEALRGYGEFPPEIAPHLLSYINKMVELLKQFP
jgi:sugar/nucleoside kinase (ribokinase family)